jgi:DNA invertase Pin-like site-specific DNA recombinase
MVYNRDVTKNPNTKKAVAYLRCSTEEQGLSGLGLDAQEVAVRAFCAANGIEVAEVVREVQSGAKIANRPKFLAARDACRRASSVAWWPTRCLAWAVLIERWPKS